MNVKLFKNKKLDLIAQNLFFPDISKLYFETFRDRVLHNEYLINFKILL